MEMQFGNYLVVKEKDNFFAVYDTRNYGRKLLTHKSSWRKATVIATLLDEAFKNGFEDARDRYDGTPYSLRND